MKKSWICNYSESNLCIFMTDTVSNSLHNEFKARKWFWLSFNHFIVHFKHYFADFKTAMQLKKNEQEENYSWHTTFAHAQNSQCAFKYWDIHWLSHELYTAAYESHSIADQAHQEVLLQLIIFWSWECDSASMNCSQTKKISRISANC